MAPSKRMTSMTVRNCSTKLLLSDGWEDRIKVGLCSGILFVKQEGLDYEEYQSFNITVKVTDNGVIPGPKEDTTEILILVLNINDPPEFLTANVPNLHVSENADSEMVWGNNYNGVACRNSIGSSCWQTQPVEPDLSLLATDPDGANNLTYSILPGDTDLSFYVEKDQSTVPFTSTLFVGGSINYEWVRYFYVRIRVTDPGGLFAEAQFMVTIDDANDPPRFTSIDASIMVAEDAVVGTKVGRRLEAFDEDQDAVQFRIGPARQQAILLGSGFGNTTVPPDSTALAIDLFYLW
jgi:hypothetical protein